MRKQWHCDSRSTTDAEGRITRHPTRRGARLGNCVPEPYKDPWGIGGRALIVSGLSALGAVTLAHPSIPIGAKRRFRLSFNFDVFALGVRSMALNYRIYAHCVMRHVAVNCPVVRILINLRYPKLFQKSRRLFRTYPQLSTWYLPLNSSMPCPRLQCVPLVGTRI